MAMAHREESRHYSMIVEWDPEDDIYVVTVPELPGCRTHGDSYEHAVRQAQDAIESWIASARADGAPIPPPRTVIARAE
jgi:predicted RNase H-like HicB family nuclease